MRRRRIAFMLRATVMATPSFITTCVSQAPPPEAAPTHAPAIEASEAARMAGQPVGAIIVRGSQNAQPGGKIEAKAAERMGVAGNRPAGVR